MRSLSQKLTAMAKLYTRELVKKHGNNFMAAILFGSVARGEPTPTSDIDVLLVFAKLPTGRMARQRFLMPRPKKIEAELEKLKLSGCLSDFNEHIKTRADLKIRTPLLYEIVHDGIILYDAKNCLQETFANIKQQMKKLGSQWKQLGRFRYLHFKPDYKPGEIFEI